jgi:hypothetical protein
MPKKVHPLQQKRKIITALALVILAAWGVKASEIHNNQHIDTN